MPWLVPEVIEDFFIQAGPLAGVHPKETKPQSHVYRLGRVPRTLQPIGDRLEPRFGKLGKEIARSSSTRPNCRRTPPANGSHPAIRSSRPCAKTLPNRSATTCGVVPCSMIPIAKCLADWTFSRRRSKTAVGIACIATYLRFRSDWMAAWRSRSRPFSSPGPCPEGTAVPDGDELPDRQAAELTLVEKALHPLLAQVAAERQRDTETISRHLELSLNTLIDRQNFRMAALFEQAETNPSLFEANKKQIEDRLDELNGRLECRREELLQERQCTIGDIQHIGRAWVLPHPERTSPGIAPMVRDVEIEHAAVAAATAYEEARGWQVESVESLNRGFDLISRKPHPEDPQTCIEVRFIEVKGRATVGEIALTGNEYKTADRLKKDYWLYVVFNCAATPEVHPIQDPARLGWEPIVKIEHYHVGADAILHESQRTE